MPVMRSLVSFTLALISVAVSAQTPAPTIAPAASPGQGLAQHDFVYSGESHRRRIFIVRDGHIAWSYEHDPAGKGEISDMVMLSNGNILFAHQFGVTLISPDKRVLWNHDAPAGFEIHTAIPIGTEHVLYVQNGNPATVNVVNITTGAMEKQFTLATRQPPSTHGQFRRVRLTPQGTLLVAHMDLNKVVEYDSDGHELWSFPGNSPWGVEQLANNNILITDHVGVREVTRRGDTVWSFTRADAPGYNFANLQQAWRLPNGNTVINNWANEWNGPDAVKQSPLQAIEVTPDKKIVWVLNSWTPPEDLGPATTLQFLDKNSKEPGAPEDVHFGDIH